MSATADLLARLRRHYIVPGRPLPGGVFLPEVTHGQAGGSRCDAVYVGFTSTSGRILVGHELKVTRADWRKELDSPGKADAWSDQCHAWWVVAPSTAIVEPAELPAGWGLMVPDPRSKVRMKKVVAAAVHADRQPSWATTRSLISRMDTLRAQDETRVRDEAERRATERAGQSMERIQPYRRKMLEQQGETFHKVCEALGVRPSTLDGWGGPSYDDLRALAPVLAKRVTVSHALSALTSRASGFALDRVEEAVRELRAALTDLDLDGVA